jgi:histidinol-phosphatase (PHP family)
VLTDYHVHLRPDDPGTTAAEFFTQENAGRYRSVASERGIGELGVAEHVHRFEQALEVWTHPFWRESARDDIDEYCRFVREETDLRLGIEADWVSGREDRMAALLDAREWDYVVGSVHFLRDRGVDSDYGGDWDVWDTARDADEVWKAYFETLAHAASSGLYDIMAHPDLVKVWGAERPQPEKDPRYYYEPAVEAMAAAGVAAEVSTAGLRKTVGELYPAPALMEMLVDAGVPIALSSDAHVPDQLGFRYEDAVAFLADHGVTEIATFAGRVRRMEPIG